MSGTWLFYNSAQMLAFLSFVGLLLCLWRLRDSAYPAHLLAFALMLAGTFMREMVALDYGSSEWPATALYLSAVARGIKLIGAILFVRAVTVGRCGEWAWIAMLLGAAAFALGIPK